MDNIGTDQTDLSLHFPSTLGEKQKTVSEMWEFVFYSVRHHQKNIAHFEDGHEHGYIVMETGANLMGNVQYFENESHGTKLIDQIEPEQRIGGPSGVHIKEQAEVHNEEQAEEYIEEQAEAHNEEQAEAHIEEQAEVHTL